MDYVDYSHLVLFLFYFFDRSCVQTSADVKVLRKSSLRAPKDFFTCRLTSVNVNNKHLSGFEAQHKTILQKSTFLRSRFQQVNVYIQQFMASFCPTVGIHELNFRFYIHRGLQGCTI